tara:strand:+ start:1560 stop:1838 length:279 start_codon:yes stop_codon:yes gene_type:complete
MQQTLSLDCFERIFGNRLKIPPTEPKLKNEHRKSDLSMQMQIRHRGSQDKAFRVSKTCHKADQFIGRDFPTDLLTSNQPPMQFVVILSRLMR